MVVYSTLRKYFWAKKKEAKHQKNKIKLKKDNNYGTCQETLILESAFQIISSSLVLLKFESVRVQMQ